MHVSLVVLCSGKLTAECFFPSLNFDTRLGCLDELTMLVERELSYQHFGVFVLVELELIKLKSITECHPPRHLFSFYLL
jgi:hypothetical protein